MTQGPGGVLALTRQKIFTSNLLPILLGALGVPIVLVFRTNGEIDNLLLNWKIYGDTNKIT